MDRGLGDEGKVRIGGLIEEAVHGDLLHGRAIRVERYRRVEEVGECHLLFVPQSETARAAAIIDAMRGRSVVTVGESYAFLREVGMIALTADQNRVHLRINPELLRGANLIVSSKLLRVAEIHH